MSLKDKLVEMCQRPDPHPHAFIEKQRVRICKRVVSDGQTPAFWAGAVVTIESAHGTMISKRHYYRLKHDNGATDEFYEEELDHRYKRKVRVPEPETTFDAKGIAESVYDDESGPRSRAFDEAYARWPGYNDGGVDTDSAQDYILDELMAKVDDLHPLFEQWQKDAISEQLSEMIYAGLT